MGSEMCIRDRYAKLGPIQAAKFSWDKAADELNHIFNHDIIDLD